MDCIHCIHFSSLGQFEKFAPTLLSHICPKSRNMSSSSEWGLVSILIFVLSFKPRSQILNRSETENLKLCCYLSSSCSSSYCRQENLVEASTALEVRKRRNHGMSFYLCFFFSSNCAGCENSLFRIIPGVIPVWVLIILGLILVLLLLLLLLHGT